MAPKLMHKLFPKFKQPREENDASIAESEEGTASSRRSSVTFVDPSLGRFVDDLGDGDDGIGEMDGEKDGERDREIEKESHNEQRHLALFALEDQ